MKKESKISSGKSEEKGHRRQQQQQYQQSREKVRAASKFVGNEPKLYGTIYDTDVANQSELFTTTTEKIAIYSGTECKEESDIKLPLKI